MQEQAVLASFRDAESASKCEKELMRLGVSDVQVDRVDAYPGESADRLTNLITGKLPSLGGITLGTTFSSNDASILLSAHPDASGMSGNTEGLGDTTGYDVLLTAVCSPDLTEQVVHIIKEYGGRT